MNPLMNQSASYSVAPHIEAKIIVNWIERGHTRRGSRACLIAQGDAVSDRYYGPSSNHLTDKGILTAFGGEYPLASVVPASGEALISPKELHLRMAPREHSRQISQTSLISPRDPQVILPGPLVVSTTRRSMSAEDGSSLVRGKCKMSQYGTVCEE